MTDFAGRRQVAVLLYHYIGTTVALRDPGITWVPHAHLAVDFFYALSGFVIAHAYQSRMAAMGFANFIKTRIIRLHPMVVAGTIIGLVVYLADPCMFGPGMPAPFAAPPGPDWKIAAAGINGLLMLPKWPLPTRLGAYYPLNGPAWSLAWEYIASIAYGLILWRLRRKALLVLVLIAAAGLFVVAHAAGTLNVGWGWGQELAGLARVSFSFVAGMLLYHVGAASPSRLGLAWLSAILAAT